MVQGASQQTQKAMKVKEVTYQPRRNKPACDDRIGIQHLILPWAVYALEPSL
jgi:hypothetical protein